MLGPIRLEAAELGLKLGSVDWKFSGGLLCECEINRIVSKLVFAR